MRVLLAAGSLVATDSTFVYDAQKWVGGPVSTSSESGDGTVPLRSALLPVQKWGWQRANATLFPNQNHVGILASTPFLQWAVQLCANF